MTLPGMALFILLAQNAGPQQPVAPASIEGIATKAGTGEPLSRVTVKLTLVPTPVSAPVSGPAPPQMPTVIMNPLVATATPAGPRPEILLAGARGSNQPTVTTAADGKFLLENLRPGTYLMTATAPGYAPMEYGQRGPNGRGLSFTLKAGQKMQNVALSMTPAGSITGRVTDANGEPVSRALVQAQKMVYQEKGRTLVTVQSIPTDDKGDYRLFWLPPGKYFISAAPSDDRERTIDVRTGGSNAPAPDATSILIGLISAAARRPPAAGTVPGVKIVSSTRANGDVVEEATVPVYYPDALDIGNATPLDIRAGEVISGIDMTTKTSRVYRIRGTIINEVTGQPAAVGSVTLLSRNAATLPLPVSVLQASEGIGGFEIAGVLPGSYFIGASSTATPASPSPGRGISSVEVRAANVNDLIITTSTGTTVAGRVSIDAVGAIASPTTGGRGSQTIITLDPQSPGLPAMSGIVLPDGTFTISGVLPADYRVSVSTPAALIPKSILYSGKDALADGIHIGNGADGKFEIVLSNKAGRVEGNVFADRQQRIANATVVLIPPFALRQQTSLYRTAQSDAEGHFTIEGILPGRYQLFAWDDVPDRAWFDASFLRDFESQGKEVTIRETATETLDLPVIPR